MTDFEFTPSVVMRDKTRSIRPDAPISLRLLGWISEAPASVTGPGTWPVEGHEYLALVGRSDGDPDNVFGTVADYFLFDLDDESGAITYTDGTPVSYAANMSRDEFIAAVAEAIN